jgi:hypothetical protein
MNMGDQDQKDADDRRPSMRTGSGEAIYRRFGGRVTVTLTFPMITRRFGRAQHSEPWRAREARPAA